MEKEKTSFGWQQISRFRPRWADDIKWENRDGVVLVKAPRTDWRGKLIRWLTGRSAQCQIEFDEIGSFVWELCDGSHTVSEIADALVQQHQLLRREAIASLLQFLSQLHQRRLVRWEEAKNK